MPSKKSKKQNGGMSGMDMLRTGVVSLVFIAIIAGALAISIADFKDQTAECASGFDYNSTSDNCYNTSNNSQTQEPINTAFNISEDAETGLVNATGFFTTIGTLLGVAALVAIVVGAFAFFRR